MLADIVEYLACPGCGGDLRPGDDAQRCARGHSFDVARQGYVSLLVGSRAPGTADSAEMVAARERFLAAGHYAPLAAAVAESVSMRIPPVDVGDGREIRRKSLPEQPDTTALKAYRGAAVVVDAGAGTGYYLAAALRAVEHGIGLAFDVSKHAVRRAARAHPRAGAFVADVWRPLPIRDRIADVVIDVFAPRNGPEFRRILRPGGAVIVVTPAKAHLSPLVDDLGLLSVDDEKERRVTRALEGFEETGRRSIEFDMHLDPHDIAGVVGMGPSAWHTDATALRERISGYISRRVAENREKVTTKASFHLSIFEVPSRSSDVA
jgi:23S rRNA (guanine745-N1)-methyltransferase